MTMSGCGKRIPPEQYCAYRRIGKSAKVRILCFDCRALLTARTLKSYRQGRASTPEHPRGLTCGQVVEKPD